MATGDNPELEISFPMDDGSGEYASKSALFAFYSTGDELYNIDNDVTQHAGFANFENAGMKATPVIGEMNGNALYGEVAFATTYGEPDNGVDIKRTFMYSAGNNNNPPDDFPDKLWDSLLGQAVKSALVGANLLDGGSVEYKIVAAEMWTGQLDVRNSSNGNSCSGWPKDVPRTINPEPAYSDKKAQIIALDFEKNEVTNWEEDNSHHIIDISHVDDGAIMISPTIPH